MKIDLNNKIAIITGAGSGIGLATVKAFTDAGATVVASDIDISNLIQLSSTNKVFPFLSNMLVKKDADDLIKYTIDKFGKIDVVFNNVGVAVSKNSFLDVTDEEWINTLDINLLGYVRVSRAAIPHMLKNGGGTLIHTASEAARMPNKMLPNYSVSKAAVAMLSKVLATEFTHQGIRSNIISPACIRTGIFDKEGGFGDSLAEKYCTDKETAINMFVKEMGIPVGRLGTPEEIAAMAVYLASDNAKYISGANFTLDGGLTPVI